MRLNSLQVTALHENSVLNLVLKWSSVSNSSQLFVLTYYSLTKKQAMSVPAHSTLRLCLFDLIAKGGTKSE